MEDIYVKILFFSFYKMIILVFSLNVICLKFKHLFSVIQQYESAVILEEDFKFYSVLEANY